MGRSALVFAILRKLALGMAAVFMLVRIFIKMQKNDRKAAETKELS